MMRAGKWPGWRVLRRENWQLGGDGKLQFYGRNLGLWGANGRVGESKLGSTGGFGGVLMVFV